MSKRELLYSTRPKDYVITYFNGSGSGGQHRNKHANACRILHKESGAIVECQEFKSKQRNTTTAFGRLHNTSKFKIWHTRKVNEIMKGKTLEQQGEESKKDTNIKVEVKKEGKWVECKDRFKENQ